jgi:hypothetical protein
MYDFYIMEVARLNNEAITRRAKHNYYRLPSTEANLVERALSAVRAFVNKPAIQDAQNSDVLKTDN